ncbi:GLPGLI family protein [Winogradskyella marincola]|uniref:GLPGLI family protein n=1 Tax=Winogradskyella marincola TaxID=3037795 RepID=A0ABT6G062_9FLAO|nr:GLPGLI family protein [Winogradskyella sp. YYF002]MDG4715415.1 GLPGLI family protein [Winogradskyella sp. YYF002]
MKYYTLLIFLVSAIGISQQDNNLKEVSYTFNVNIFNYSEGIEYKSKLFFNDSTSLFIYNNSSIEGESGFFKKVKNRANSSNYVHLFRDYDDIGYKFFYNFNTKELTCRELLREQYEVIVKEKDIEFNWEITKETKQIGKFICYKALTKNFRGRNYEAWFTYDIPVATGPWKFHGLPGLILEVHDDKNLVDITFNSISDNIEEKIEFSEPTSDEIMSLDEYLIENFRLYTSFIDNQKGLKATGQLPSNTMPLNYMNLEYNKEQIKLLNSYNQIEYDAYEKSLKSKE